MKRRRMNRRKKSSLPGAGVDHVVLLRPNQQTPELNQLLLHPKLKNQEAGPGLNPLSPKSDPNQQAVKILIQRKKKTQVPCIKEEKCTWTTH